MLTPPFGTTSTFDINLVDANLAPVEGATATVTIEDAGSEVLEATTMTDLGSGNYSYIIAADLLTKPRHRYTVKATATNGSYVGYFEDVLYTMVDNT